MPGSGMHHHPGRLVNYKQVIVFKDNIKRNILPHQPTGHGGKDAYFHLCTSFDHLPGFFGRNTIDRNKAVIDQALQARPRKFRQAIYQKFINPLRFFPGVLKIFDALTHDCSLLIGDGSPFNEDCSPAFFRSALSLIHTPSNRTATPTEMEESATLKAGQ